MTITIIPSEQGLGAEFKGVDFSQPIDDATQAELINAFSDHHVLSFRGQDGLSTDHVLAASRVTSMHALALATWKPMALISRALALKKMVIRIPASTSLLAGRLAMSCNCHLPHVSPMV